MKSLDLIAVSTFRSTADARMAKGILDEAGIAATGGLDLPPAEMTLF